MTPRYQLLLPAGDPELQWLRAAIRLDDLQQRDLNAVMTLLAPPWAQPRSLPLPRSSRGKRGVFYSPLYLMATG